MYGSHWLGGTPRLSNQRVDCDVDQSEFETGLNQCCTKSKKGGGGTSLVRTNG